MQEITKQKYFYYIAFMLMASTFLPLVFNNLPRIIRSHHLWTIIWIFSLLVYNPQIFLNKTMAYSLGYGFLLFLSMKTFWIGMDVWNKTRLYFEFYEIFIGISVFTYFIQSKDFIGLAKITKWALIFLFITAIMSIISSTIDPLYARNLTGLSSVSLDSEREKILSYKRYGGGGYGTAAAFMCLFPGLIYYYKNNNLSPISKKNILIFSIIVFVALLGMQIFGNILIAVVFSVIALIGMKKIRISVFVILIIFSAAMIIPRGVYVNGLESISKYFERYSELNYKFNDFADFIETGADINDHSTSAGSRAERYPILIETFVKNPILGCYFFSDESINGYNSAGAHLYWMNKLTITGIIGFVIFLFIPYIFIKTNLRHFHTNYKFYYILSSLAVLSYGLIKVIGGRDTWYAFFIILPGLYFLPLLKNSGIKDEFNRGK